MWRSSISYARPVLRGLSFRPEGSGLSAIKLLKGSEDPLGRFETSHPKPVLMAQAMRSSPPTSVLNTRIGLHASPHQQLTGVFTASFAPLSKSHHPAKVQTNLLHGSTSAFMKDLKLLQKHSTGNPKLVSFSSLAAQSFSSSDELENNQPKHLVRDPLQCTEGNGRSPSMPAGSSPASAFKPGPLAVSTSKPEAEGGKRPSMSMLKASQLKEVLELGGVDYRDCLEKRELVARLEETQLYIPPAAQRLLAHYLQAEGDKEDLGPSGVPAMKAPVDLPVSLLETAPAVEAWWMAAERNMIQRFQEASPAVANITTTVMASSGLSMNPVEMPRGTGSGFVWDRQGHLVTNYHVVMNGTRAKVTLADASTWDAEVVGAAPEKDLAVLRIEAPQEKLRPVSLGSSRALQVGQHVLAIGNPFGLDRTLTAGIISGVGRDIRSVNGRLIRGVIQTDASINPGNSGGPLLDSQGRLIGVNTAIYSPSGASAGVGFAIPVDTVRRVVTQLLHNGRVLHPALGVVCASDGQARQVGVAGVLLLGVTRGSAAAQAGIKATTRDDLGRIILGDVIVALNGQALSQVEDLLAAVEEHGIGETVRVTVRRGGALRDFYVTLTETTE